MQYKGCSAKVQDKDESMYQCINETEINDKVTPDNSED